MIVSDGGFKLHTSFLDPVFSGMSALYFAIKLSVCHLCAKRIFSLWPNPAPNFYLGKWDECTANYRQDQSSLQDLSRDDECYYMKISLNAALNGLSLSSSLTLNYTQTHMHTQREPYVQQVK